MFRSGDLTVDLVRRVVTVRGQEVKFSPREYEVLRLLVQHAGKVLTHKMILREVWGGDTDVQYLRIYIRALRQKIEQDPERPAHILTRPASATACARPISRDAGRSLDPRRSTPGAENAARREHRCRRWGDAPPRRMYDARRRPGVPAVGPKFTQQRLDISCPAVPRLTGTWS